MTHKRSKQPQSSSWAIVENAEFPPEYFEIEGVGVDGHGKVRVTAYAFRGDDKILAEAEDYANKRVKFDNSNVVAYQKYLDRVAFRMVEYFESVKADYFIGKFYDYISGELDG